ncbi:MAG TPA: reverse transcriptase domain-containing protein, partial [Chlamydiales bacterium]|nr:reverse transcriptase domain-containing protein [Chlamydiales bacterium]
SWHYFNTKTRKIQHSRNITFNRNDTALFPIPNLDALAHAAPVPPNATPIPRETPDTPQRPASPYETMILSQQGEIVPGGGSDHGDPHDDPADVPVTPPHQPPQPTPQPDNGRRRSSRIANQNHRWDYSTMARLQVQDQAMLANIVAPPLTYLDAQRRPDFLIWKEAMDTEMAQHNERHTWDLVDLPEGRSIVGCRWVYATKSDADGNFQKAKARLVAQGMTQVPGIDYFDITSPVARFDSLRILLAVGNQQDWESDMMDVKGAYLNAELEEDIYMHQPPGYDDETGHVLRLRLALYGLKQAGRVWYHRLRAELLKLGYGQSAADECIFIRLAPNGERHIIIVYVDDLVIFTGSRGSMNDSSQTGTTKCFRNDRPQPDHQSTRHQGGPQQRKGNARDITRRIY